MHNYEYVQVSARRHAAGCQQVEVIVGLVLGRIADVKGSAQDAFPPDVFRCLGLTRKELQPS